jgi:hypothetical protein
MLLAKKIKIVVVEKRLGAGYGRNIVGKVFRQIGMAIDPLTFMIVEHFV